MKKRILRFIAVLIAAAIAVMGVVPVRSSAIVPLGLVQSALASYVTSAGYKLYNDQGTGQDILGSLGDLYDDYVTLNNKTISGSLATLAYLANSPLIYTDNSGQICINAVAANIMQGFADYLQTEYSIPVGDSTPTQIVQPSGVDWTDGNGINATKLENSRLVSTNVGNLYQDPDHPIGVTEPGGSDLFLLTSSPSSFYLTQAANPSGGYNRLYGMAISGNVPLSGVFSYSPSLQTFIRSRNLSVTLTTSWSSYLFADNYSIQNIALSTVVPTGDSELTASGGISGLAASLAQAVTDVVGQAADDDAVVVGVGAGVGATAQDIAGLVADGIKAGTLEPSVSIVAEDVIDTPVQPYPDIDGLGLPQLGAALTDRFPFCIPWDFVGALKLLNADPIPPVFDVPLVPDAVKARWGVTGNTTLHVDLTTQEYAKVFLAIRWGTLISFCLGLTLLTKRLIWTA